VVAASKKGDPVTADDLGVAGALMVCASEAIDLSRFNPLERS
jgi:formyltetrahydrofolate synthetase